MNKKILNLLVFAILSTSGMSSERIAAEEIKIGAIFAKTGLAAESNAIDFQAVHFAIRELNQRGGLLGKKLRLLEFDNRSTLVGSKVAADQAVKAKVLAVIGATWSSHSLHAAPVLQKAKIPMISPSSTNPRVTEMGDYIFRVCFVDSFQGKVMAQFARRELQAETAVIFKDLRSDYSLGLAQAFREHFERIQGRILLELPYKRKQEDFKHLLQETKAANPDILFISGHGLESALIAKQAQDLGIPAIPIGGDSWGNLPFLSKGGGKLKRGYYSTHWSKEVKGKISYNFVKRFQKYHSDVKAKEALAYDAVMVLADAVRRANSLERLEIRKALAETKNFQGVTGVITFDEQGDPVKNAVIMELTHGDVRYLKTVVP